MHCVEFGAELWGFVFIDSVIATIPRILLYGVYDGDNDYLSFFYNDQKQFNEVTFVCQMETIARKIFVVCVSVQKPRRIGVRYFFHQINQIIMLYLQPKVSDISCLRGSGKRGEVEQKAVRFLCC